MTNTQIVSLYETSNISVEDIAENFELDTKAIKMVLLSGSPKYRRALKVKDETFDDSEVAYAKQVMTQLLDCDVENVKYRAAKYVIDESKGRNDIKNVQNTNINVNLIINDQMKRALSAANNAINMKPLKASDEQIHELELVN